MFVARGLVKFSLWDIVPPGKDTFYDST